MSDGKIQYATSTGGVDIAYRLVGPEAGRRVVFVPGFITHLDFADQFGPTRLDRHDETSRRVVEQFGGRVVKQMGDGLMATFDGPARAVESARALRDALASDLPIRAGLHTGEVERRGDDVGGIGVHIAARVAALAGAGEVLVSRTVRDLVVGSDLGFEDRGTHELKGVPDTWQLYAAVE
jgi:class 3 adenylate cyclase